MSRNFEISPKTTNEQLKEVRFWGSYNMQLQVAQDVVNNAKELAPDLNWDFTRKHVVCYFHGKKYEGVEAILHSVSRTIGSVAGAMGWDMHSPEVVYMGGYHIAWGLGKDVERMSGKLGQIEKGEITYSSQDQRDGAVQRLLRSKEILLDSYLKLKNPLTEYASVYLGEDEKKLQVLGSLVYLPRMNVVGERRSALFKILKQDDYDRAYSMLGRP